jgi:hypothetical protein
VVTWGEFTRSCPELARVARELIYDNGKIGLGFLATVRPDGGPRVHPICPLVNEDGLFGFIVPGPKREDLLRDGRYALHSETCPPPRHDDGLYVAGRAALVGDLRVWSAMARQLLVERGAEEHWPGFETEELFEFELSRCLVTLTEARDGLPAGNTTWTA